MIFKGKGVTHQSLLLAPVEFGMVYEVRKNFTNIMPDGAARAIVAEFHEEREQPTSLGYWHQ